jgi:hypothetical protein
MEVLAGIKESLPNPNTVEADKKRRMSVQIRMFVTILIAMTISLTT